MFHTHVHGHPSIHPFTCQHLLAWLAEDLAALAPSPCLPRLLLAPALVQILHYAIIPFPSQEPPAGSPLESTTTTWLHTYFTLTPGQRPLLRQGPSEHQPGPLGMLTEYLWPAVEQKSDPVNE